MTLRMAAGQQKKRLTSSNLCEQYKGKKKKKLDSSDYMLNLKSHVSLEWDDHKKRTVAKREQIGITLMDMAPFIDSLSQPRSGLADVLSVPQEIFGLENLTEVLSYEVWATCLSEQERKLLTQFLPSGTAAEQVVLSLLMGENHHFGNPFLKWSASLCSGSLHPDDVLYMERQRKANKNAYCLELKKYHNDMLEVLKKLKEIWTSCENPEKLRKAFAKPKQGCLHISAERAEVDCVSKKEMPCKLCMHCGDGAKYMYCFKISRKQYELVKSVKHSGDGIQSKTLSCVLGDVKSFNIQSYEVFEEEEKKRLHEHWLQVARHDLTAAFEDRRSRKLQREKWRESLEHELAEKMKLEDNKDVETENLGSSLQEQSEGGDSEHHLVAIVPDEEEGNSNPNSTYDHHLERTPSYNSDQEINSIHMGREAVVHDTLEPTDLGRSNPAKDVIGEEDDGENIAKPSCNFFGRANPPEDAMNGEPVDQQILQSANDFFGRASPTDDVTELKASISSSKEMWQTVGSQDSYYHTSTGSQRYTSGDLSLRQSQTVKEQQTPAIDLETDILEQCNTQSVAAPAIHMENGSPLFCPYANQGQSELFPTFSKAPEMMSPYSHEHLSGLKQPALQFLMANESLLESGHFSHPFEEQLRFVEQGQVREKDLYMHQMMNKNMRPSDHYPRNTNFASVDQQSQAVRQSSVDAGLVSHNWFPDEYRARNCWPQASHQLSNNVRCSGDGGSADGSLYSVVSACKMMSPRTSVDITRSDQFIQARNFVGGGIPNNDNIYSYPPNQVTGSSSYDAAMIPPAMKVDGVSWLRFPSQNHGLHDLAAKQFPRPWNQ